MKTFLEQVAKAMWAEHGSALADVAVVLPSRRAGLYLRRALAREAGAPIWSPQVFTLSSFMERLSGTRILPMEELLLEAYEAYRVVSAPETRPLEDFLEWAPTTLADISEADAHLLGLQGFYRDLRSWEEIEWTFNTSPLSDGQQRLVRYWALAGRLHAALNERLLAMGGATAGLAERRAAESMGRAPWDRIWFCGLNALTPAQIRVMDSAMEAGQARFAWDADGYYLGDDAQEAGSHLRAAIKRYGAGVVAVSEALREGVPKLQVMRTAERVGQAWCAAATVRSEAPGELTDTAIVLADGALLPAMLEALPAEVGSVNITMGLPLAQLPIGSLVAALLDALGSRRSDGAWRIADVIAVLGHAYLRNGAAGEALGEVINGLGEGASVMVGGEQLEKLLARIPGDERGSMAAVFAMDAPARMRVSSLLLRAQDTMRADRFATEGIYQAALILQRTCDLLERYGHAKDPQVWRLILLRLMRRAQVGYFGEPLSGLQVMGMLEARALDHQRLVVVGVAEGQLPQADAQLSFIPYELRRAHGMPLRESSDAVQAYNFFRMLQRPAEGTLVYSAEQEGGGPSRFLMQLAHEHPKYHELLSGLIDVRTPVPVRSADPVVVTRTVEHIDVLRKRLAKGLSPTMLRAWLQCPLDHWFRYVQGLKEPERAGARIRAQVLGEAVHGFLEDSHRPWLEKPLEAADLLAVSNSVEEGLLMKLSELMDREQLMRGQPLLQRGMSAHAITAYTQSQASAVAKGQNIVVTHLEHAFSIVLPGSREAFGFDVLVAGRIDKVERRDGLVHVLDLKTGNVDPEDLRIKQVGLQEVSGKKGYSAQLLMYAWAWFMANPGVESLRAGLIPLQRSSAGEGVFLNVEGEDLLTREVLPTITRMLLDAVTDMLAAGPVHHTEGSLFCAFCLDAKR